MKPTRYLGALLAALLLASCASVPPARSSASPPARDRKSVVQEAIRDIGIASPASLKRAERSLSESTQGYSDEGIELSYVAYMMIKILYPLYLKSEYVILPPVASIYPSIFRAVEAGRWAAVPQGEASFITLILPPLAVLTTKDSGVVDQAKEALGYAAALNPASVLPTLLMGFLAERGGDDGAALADYDATLAKSSDCYPATVGKARILLREKRDAEAESLLAPLYAGLPPDGEIAQLYATSLFREGRLAEAERAIDRALAAAPKSVVALTLAARIADAQRNYGKALDEIDAAERLGPLTPEIILLKAQLLREQGNWLAALDLLQRGTRLFPQNEEIGERYGKALIEAGRTTEGSRYIVQTIKDNPNSVESLELLVDDAIGNHDYGKAARYVKKLLELSRSDRAVEQAYVVESHLGHAKEALGYARELYERHPDSPAYLLPYVHALLAAGERSAARTAIDLGLKETALAGARSDLYLLRSTLAGSESAQLADLKASLLENLGNLYALVAISRLYRRMGENDLAARYLSEAAAIAPDDPLVKRALEEANG